MIKENTKLTNSLFNNNFVRRLSLYLHDCVREEVQSSTFRNLKQDKDNKWIFLEQDQKNYEENSSFLKEERLFTIYPNSLKLDGSDPLLTELMLQNSNGQKDKYLIYGYLFLVGKNSKSKRKNEFLTPLLYSACNLERSGMNVECSLQEEGLSLNTAAITSLMNLQGEEDEIDNMLDGLLDVVPPLPLKEENLKVFLTALKALIPDLDIELNTINDIENNIDSGNETINAKPKVNFDNIQETIDEVGNGKNKTEIKADKVMLVNKSAIILTKRPLVTAGVLYELTQLSEKPSGTIRETALNIINEEYLQSMGKMPSKTIKDTSLNDFLPITPLPLSEAQENVIKNLEDNNILSVYGPPGTGKTQTIVNLICHLIASGKTVLVASRMDKAADVIADRVNSFNAPFLALRAGRTNYQKQLSNDLQDLISGKFDLDTGFENSILVDNADIKGLFNQILEMEDNCEKLIELEQKWQKINKEYISTIDILGNIEILKKKYTLSEIDVISKAVNKLVKCLRKKDILSCIFTYIENNKLKKLINKKDFKSDIKNLERIKLELEMAKLSAQICTIENNIKKYGDINKILKEIKLLKKKQNDLAIDVLKGKRRSALKELLRDQVKRQRLIIHTKALVTKKQNLQYRLLEDEDFKPLLEAFPCWCVTSYSISNSLPLKPALFDVAIIDEASQCDIASCIPILFRCKKAVIVGDDKQLPHLSFLEKSKEQSFLSQYEIPDKYQLMWKFRTNSMFDLANYYSMKSVLLDEHFRSASPIIEFSNKEFYNGRIRIMSTNEDNHVLELIRVSEGKVDSDMTRNMPETEAVMQRLQELINEDNLNSSKENYKPITIGIISPFRGQVELIKKALRQLYSDSILDKYKIEVGTAHTFQGDERDVIMLSWAIADNSFNQSLTFLQIPNLFNVAVTRAKKKQIVFLSKNPQTLPDGLLRDYIEYVMTYSKQNEIKELNNFEENYYKNDFEKEVADELRNIGLNITAGKVISGVSADLFVKYSNGNSLIIECDGIEDNVKIKETPIKKHSLMEKTGIKIERLSYREWTQSKQGCIDRFKNYYL